MIRKLSFIATILICWTGFAAAQNPVCDDNVCLTEANGGSGRQLLRTEIAAAYHRAARRIRRMMVQKESSRISPRRFIAMIVRMI